MSHRALSMLQILRPVEAPRPGLIAIVAIAAVLGACGQSGGGSDPDAEAHDTGLDLPDALDEPVPAAEPAATGLPCTEREDCGGTACLDLPGGYCSVSPCTGGYTVCPGDGVCDFAETRRECLDACTSPGDCRDGYGCVDLESGRQVCLPVEPIGPPSAGGPGDTMECWGIPYGGTVHVPVNAQPDGISHTLVAHTNSGRVKARRVWLRNGSSIDLAAPFSYLSEESGYQVTPSATQVTLPATQGGAEADEVSAVAFATEGAESLCIREHTRTEPGDVVRLNVYVNTLEDMDAEKAMWTRALRDVFVHLGEIYRERRLDFEVGYHDLDPDVALAYRLVRNDLEAGRLTAQAHAPPMVEELSLNVFLVESLVSGNSPLLGLSRGIPGPAGLHGTGAGGVIVLAGGLAEGDRTPASVAQTLAHELGHFLGLYHTTEGSGLYFDPLSDTPECPRDSYEWRYRICPDRNNLMWPYAGSGNVTLTHDQAWVIRRHPLAVGVEDTEGAEVCDDDEDNDGDGSIDCIDPDCYDNRGCTYPPREDCTDGLDNDMDGSIDCGDSACARAEHCIGLPPEICDDGADQDLDYAVDCEDSDCIRHPFCDRPVPEICGDGYDNDLDGGIDCDDTACLDHDVCLACGDDEVGRGGACVSLFDPDQEGALSGPWSYISSFAIGASGSETDCCRDMNGDGRIDNAFARFTLLSTREPIYADWQSSVRSRLGESVVRLIQWDTGPSGTGLWIWHGHNDIDGDGVADNSSDERVEGRGSFGVLSSSMDAYGALTQFNDVSVDGDAFVAGPARIPAERWLTPIPVSWTHFRDELLDPPPELWLEDAMLSGERTHTETGWSSEYLLLDRTWELSGYLRMDAIAAYLEAQLRPCACAGIEDGPILSWGIEDGRFLIECEQTPRDRTYCTSSPYRVCSQWYYICQNLEYVDAWNIPDLDTDGDGIADAMSVGVRIGAAGATVVPMEIEPEAVP